MHGQGFQRKSVLYPPGLQTGRHDSLALCLASGQSLISGNSQPTEEVNGAGEQVLTSSLTEGTGKIEEEEETHSLPFDILE